MISWMMGGTPADVLGRGFEWFVREPGLQLFVTVGQPHRLRGGQGRRVGFPDGFASRWLLIRSFNGAIRRNWLAAIDRRAQALATSHR